LDLPTGDESAGLKEYADTIVEDRAGAVARSCWWPSRWAATPRRWRCDRLPVEQLILVNAMVPAPGESPGELLGQHRAVAGGGRIRGQ